MSRSIQISLRVLIDVIIFVCVLEGWWFVALPLGLIGVWMFPWYTELLVAGIAYDSLFGLVPGMGLKGYAASIAAILIFLVSSASKKFVRR